MSEHERNRVSGTKEWSIASVNIILGCEHKCRYCYARANAVRRKLCPNMHAWGEEYLRVRPAEVRKRRRLEDGRVMFPTTHDITPRFLDECVAVLNHILLAGNTVLVVSKPHLSCIERLCREFRREQDRIVFRFSVGALSDSILAYWEPAAPGFEERFASLRYAHGEGFATSVSAEPLLDMGRAAEMFAKLEPYVSDTFWFGKLNGISSRVICGTSQSEIERVVAGQAFEKINQLYTDLKGEPKVRWKESYKSVLGMAFANKAGLDV